VCKEDCGEQNYFLALELSNALLVLYGFVVVVVERRSGRSAGSQGRVWFCNLETMTMHVDHRA
jgi:hypothetical protein